MNNGQRLLVLLAMTAVALAGCASTEPDHYPPDTVANAPADVDYFYASLGAYGQWFEMPAYGWVWCPYGTPAGWRPYTVGYWTYTDYGWMWISEDPWGWAPYHYGRWTLDAFYGWIWIPGDVWAPAWVAWRYGDGWVGWAPLPPEIGWRVGVGLDVGTFDIDQGIDAHGWCFVRDRDLVTRRIRSRVLPAARNTTLMRVTKDATRYTILKDRPADRGLDPDVIQRVVGRALPRYRLIEAQTPPRGRSGTIRGDAIEVYRPVITGRTAREISKPLPPARTKVVPPDVALKRQEAERRRFDATMERERAKLEREQQQELKRLPAGTPMEELRRRQQEEMRAQQERERRERETLEHRNEQLRKVVEERRQELQKRQEQQRLERERQQVQRRQQQQQQQDQRKKDKEQEKEKRGKERGRKAPPGRD